MRFGLVGAGPWARMTHGPGLLEAAADAELIGVWGRNPERVAATAGTLGVAAYADIERLYADVDAVAFCVPPSVQAELAVQAARAGRHLLLEKPLATTLAEAERLRDAVADAGVASVVFFTDQFRADTRPWFEQAASTTGWRGGWMRWISALQVSDTGFGDSPWRQQSGALWDIGPHAVSTLSATLGPVVGVQATGGAGDLVVLVLTHRGGATSTATLSLFAPPAASGFDVAIWGEQGVLPMPPRPEGTVVDAYATAVVELVEAARTGRPHPLDASFGAHVVGVLADAERQIAAGRG